MHPPIAEYSDETLYLAFVSFITPIKILLEWVWINSICGLLKHFIFLSVLFFFLVKSIIIDHISEVRKNLIVKVGWALAEAFIISAHHFTRPCKFNSVGVRWCHSLSSSCIPYMTLFNLFSRERWLKRALTPQTRQAFKALGGFDHSRPWMFHPRNDF